MTRQREPVTCGHPDRPHYALNCCKPCYEALNRRQNRERAERLARRVAELEQAAP